MIFCELSKRAVLLAACLCLIACNQDSADGSRAKSISEPGGQPQVLFAVSVEEYQGMVMRRLEPIVLIKDGKFTEPPFEENTIQKFGETYLNPGLTYHLLWGGKKIGMVKVKEWIKEGCSGPVNMAEVEMLASLELKGEVGALATNVVGLGHGKLARRAPTELEKTRALEVARNIYRSNGISDKLLRSIEFQLVAADLDADQVEEVIGNFRIEEHVPDEHGLDIPSVYALFLLLKSSAKGLRPLVTQFHRGRGDSYREEKFLDHLDLDEDGISEVFTKSYFYEGWGYRIYKSLGTEWKEVYRGGGGGC
jgi:hypothetical protein